MHCIGLQQTEITSVVPTGNDLVCCLSTQLAFLRGRQMSIIVSVVDYNAAELTHQEHAGKASPIDPRPTGICYQIW